MKESESNMKVVASLGHTCEYEYLSKALNRKKRFAVIYPDGYHVQDLEYPLILVLHGMGRNHMTVAGQEHLRVLFGSCPFVSVFPDGERGCYIDSPVDPESRYQSYLKEIWDWASHNLRVRKEAASRAVIGWSMGAFGAAHYLAAHPGTFGVFVSIIGLLDFPNPARYDAGQHYPVPHVFPRDDKSRKVYRAAEQADLFKNMEILMMTGSTAFDHDMNVVFHDSLQQKGIPHEFKVLEGGHEWALVEQAFPLALTFCRDALDI